MASLPDPMAKLIGISWMKPFTNTSKDMVLYGSGSIASTLMQRGLVDEYQVWVNPVVLGQGKPLFAGVIEPVKLNLLQTTAFKNGVVLLSYEPAQK